MARPIPLLPARAALIAVCAQGLSALAAEATVQGYPSRPIRMLVGFSAGGGSDFAARIAGQKISEAMGQPVEYPFVKGIDGFPHIIEVRKLEHERVNFGGIFGNLFGGGRRGRRSGGPQPGQDLEAELHLSFDDSVRGITAPVRFRSDASCSTCSGSGAAPGTSPRPAASAGAWVRSPWTRARSRSRSRAAAAAAAARWFRPRVRRAGDAASRCAAAR